jgi:hypothetical protein
MSWLRQAAPTLPHPSREWMVSIFPRQASDVDRTIKLLHLSFEIAGKKITKTASG